MYARCRHTISTAAASGEHGDAGAHRAHDPGGGGQRPGRHKSAAGRLDADRAGVSGRVARDLCHDCGDAVRRGLGGAPRRAPRPVVQRLLGVLFAAACLLWCAGRAPGVMAAAALTPDAAELSYTLCAADVACAQRHGLAVGAASVGTAHAHFLYVLPVALAGRPELGDAAALINECADQESLATDAETALRCDGARFVWLAVLRGAYPCQNANEVWQVGVGCVCELGRRCHDECAATSLNDLAALIVIGVLFLLGGAVGALVIFSTLRAQAVAIEAASAAAQNAFAVTSMSQPPQSRSSQHMSV